MSPRWLQKTFSMSNGVAPNRSATADTSGGATNRNTAAGSTNRRISHGQAMRSTLGRDRVTQTVRPSASRAGISATGTSGSPASRHASKPPSRFSAGVPGVPEPRGGAFAELLAPLTNHDGGPAPNAVDHAADSSRKAPEGTRHEAGIGVEILLGADVDDDRALLRADEAGEFLDGNAGW
jgi:hypothetical protein